MRRSASIIVLLVVVIAACPAAYSPRSLSPLQQYQMAKGTFTNVHESATVYGKRPTTSIATKAKILAALDEADLIADPIFDGFYLLTADDAGLAEAALALSAAAAALRRALPEEVEP